MKRWAAHSSSCSSWSSRSRRRVLLLAGACERSSVPADTAAGPGADRSAANIWRAPPIAWPATRLPGGKPFAGGLPFKLPFGTIYAPNITPDKETGIGNWSDAEFVRALHRGVGRDGEMLYPAFPYAVLRADEHGRRAGDQGLPVQPAAGARAETPADTARFPLQPALPDALLDACCSCPAIPSSPNAASPRTGTAAATSSRRWAIAANATRRATSSTALDSGRKFAGAVTEGWKAYNISSRQATPASAPGRTTQLASYLSQGHAEGAAPPRAAWPKR